MRIRITLLIPVILVASTLISSVMVYGYAKQEEETKIRKEVITQVKLDIARLQNVLYNRLTEKASNIEEARLNLSVTAMDNMIRNLLLTDEHYQIILANRYQHEGNMASHMSNWFDQQVAEQVKQTNRLKIDYARENNTLLQGYFPVVLQLESEGGTPTKRVGILYVEVNIAQKLAAAFSNEANHSLYFAGFMLTVSLFIAWLLHQLISKRLNQLSGVAAQFAAGDLNARATLNGKDELGNVGSAFNNMAERIKSDIQRRQKAEEELRLLNDSLEERVSERTQQLQEAQRIGHMGNWSWDTNHGEHFWSEEVYRIFGYQPDDINPTHEHFIAAIHPDDVTHVKQAEQAACSQGKRQSIDHRIILPNGKERWVHEEIEATPTGVENPTHLAGTIQDITERKQIEQNLRQAKEEAEQASKAKSVFLSHMSHELRTPLNAILGFSQVLQMESITTDQQSFVEEIKQAGDHLLALIGELLDLSRIETGQLSVVMESVSLDKVMNEAIKLNRDLIEKNQLQLQRKCLEKYHVIADKVRLRQVLVNLISNAAKYNRAGGTINVQCASQDGRVKISIMDNGKGIKAEHMHKLFTPFERIEADRSGVDGTGIGLALSKQIIELMNGTIGVESEQGVGSTFWITLPMAKKTITRREATGKSEQTRETIQVKHKVLYIEDNARNLRLVQSILKLRNDIECLSATNAQQGLQIAASQSPDLILMDMNLPDLDGYSAFDALQSQEATKYIPVFAVTANAMAKDMEQGMAYGFRQYITKPIDVKEFMQAIDKELENK